MKTTDLINEEFDMDNDALMDFETELEAPSPEGLPDVGTVFTFPKSRRNRTYQVIGILGDTIEYGMVDKPEKGVYSMPITHEIIVL